jgi:hypothetical protein
VGEEEGRQGKYTARGGYKATVEEVERMEEQHSCLRRKTRGFLQQEVAREGNSGEPQCSEAKQRQRRKRKEISRGLVCNFRKLQGPLGKEEFNHCSRAQRKM